MKRASLTAVLSVLFAIAAAGAVFLYVQSARQSAVNGEQVVNVIVSTVDIPANAAIDPLIASGDFRVRAVPRDALVQGVVTDMSQLRGQYTAYPILAGEQISAARFRGALQARGGSLGITGGDQAMSISLDPQRVVSGALQVGDHVEVYGTFDQTSGDGSLTRVIVPDAKVLSVPPSASTSTGSSSSPGGEVTITLEVTPEQAELLIYSQERGSVWMTLLPPNQAGARIGPVLSKGVGRH